METKTLRKGEKAGVLRRCIGRVQFGWNGSG